MELSIVILAAGKSTRMNSSLSKIMHKIANHEIIYYVLDRAKEIKPKEVHVVLSPDSDNISHKIKQYYREANIVIQKKQLGTGDAVKEALSEIRSDGITLILYGDTPLISLETINNLLETFKRDSNASVAVLGFKAEDPAQYGRIILNKEGKVDRIVEFADASQEEKLVDICNSGIIAAKTSFLKKHITDIKNDNKKGEYYLTDIVKIAGDNGFSCSYSSAEFTEVMGVNNRLELALCEKVMQNILHERAMLAGVTMISPETVILSHDTKFGKDVLLEPNIFIGPKTVIEDNVVIKSFSHIEGAIIRNSASVGPFARIRPGTEIRNMARIGNFVEIKNSIINTNTKINHLSYIGDSEVGENTNIGAGVITCNYDGFNKFKTTIGSNVFLGSNTTIIAPVIIEDGSLIGAGSVITDNVAKNDLAISRTKQINYKGRALAFRKKHEIGSH